eukprot:TRINITY_DN26816_c0_g1_i1.p1 TRINITY_DN26816_c0_g1~~TRINITY_DN26816_c0_g1_i1.p1  ORF type:complete len:265 (+),score=82.15 TRINITY_DN26816_c0_g1_i1:26-820(+)
MLQDDEGSVAEKTTGVEFPSYLDSHRLLGIGVRKKYLFSVYAFGIYMDEKSLIQNLEEHWGENPYAKTNPTFYQHVLRSNIEKTVRLVFTRGVGGSEIAESFRDQLEPRLKQRVYVEENPDNLNSSDLSEQHYEATKSLEAFRTACAPLRLNKGSTLSFQWKDAILTVDMDGQTVVKLKSAELAWAFFSIYIGFLPVPISITARDQVFLSVRRILREKQEDEQRGKRKTKSVKGTKNKKQPQGGKPQSKQQQQQQQQKTFSARL